MVVNFGKKMPKPVPVAIQVTEVELVSTYRYLGVHLDHKLEWKFHTETLYKGQIQPVLYK